jgi:hypothetical protein
VIRCIDGLRSRWRERPLENITVPVIDDETRRRIVASILLRLQRYVRGYLPYLRIETDEDFSKNPAEVRIRVWWKNEKGEVTLEDNV